MKRKSIIVFGIVALSLCALPAFAYGPFSGRGTGECRYDWPVRESSLTAEQQTQLRELRQDYLDQTRELREGLREKRQEMRAVLEGGKADEKQLKGLQKEINALQARMGDARIEHALKVKDIDPQAFAGYAGGGYGRHAWKTGRTPCSRAW